ncbi:MAG: type IX secretion system sortase PorU, partial [Bacteroidota bacterium]|nr:type IX secretion system sortase PorU [Bacteroidota bacterium]
MKRVAFLVYRTFHPLLLLFVLFLVRCEAAVAQVEQGAGTQSSPKSSAIAERVSGDIRVLDSSEQGITVEFTPQYFPLKKDTVNSSIYDVVQFKRGLSYDYSFAGKPDVGYRSLLIGLPGRNGNTITVLQSDVEMMHGISLRTITAPSSIMKEVTGTQVNDASEFLPKDIVSLSDIGIVQGIFVGTIVLNPVQYQQSAHTLKKYSRIVFRVTYGRPETAAGYAGIPEWGSRALLNGAMVERFATARPPLAKTAQVNSVLASGKWVKLEIQSDGMYKIDASYLHTIGMDAAVGGSFSNIKIYGNNGRVLPPDLNDPRPADLTQYPVFIVDNNGNGSFDADDYLLFYAPGVTGWDYSSTQKTFSHYINPYTNSNYCFIRYVPGGTQSTMQAVSISGAVGGDVTTAVGKVFFHEEKSNDVHSGLEWYSSAFGGGDSRVISNKLNGYISGTPVTYTYELLARANVFSSFTILESDKMLTTVPIAAMSDDDLNYPAAPYAESINGQITTIPSLNDQRSNLKLIYQADSKSAKGWIYWIEILYTQQLVPVNDELLFTSPDTSGTVEYNLSGFSSSAVRVFNVANVFDVRAMAVTQAQETGRILFKDTLSSGSIKKYWAGTSAAYKTPASFIAIPNTNLRGITPGADFVIITHHDFLTQAQQLRDYKESLPNGDALKTLVVEVDTLYNEFGDGMPDPTAFRDFLKYAVTNWPLPPRYVLFFGDATFDYKNNLGLGKDWVPTYETPVTNDQGNTFGYDDYFCALDPQNNTKVSLAHGRLAVRTPAEAQLVIDKIKQYETSVPRDPWKNTIALVADDAHSADQNDGDRFVSDAEELASPVYLPKTFDVKKIYEVDYPTVIAASGLRKPAARQAILDQVNRGTLVLNFIGHGNPTVWAHEYILTQNDVNTQFSNTDRLTFVCAATCDWGRFDDGSTQSSAEDIITNPNGGAVGVLSSDRLVFDADNVALNE